MIYFALFLILCLIIVAIADLKNQKIPNILNVAILVSGLAFSFNQIPITTMLPLVLLVYLMGFFLSLAAEHILQRPALGQGDVKLVAACVPWVGAMQIPLMIALAAGSALLVIWATKAQNNAVAFGPYVAGSVAFIFAAQQFGS